LLKIIFTKIKMEEKLECERGANEKYL